MPDNVESIADLMAFDTDINVYGDSNVYIPNELLTSGKGARLAAGRRMT